MFTLICYPWQLSLKQKLFPKNQKMVVIDFFPNLTSWEDFVSQLGLYHMAGKIIPSLIFNYYTIITHLLYHNFNCQEGKYNFAWIS